MVRASVDFQSEYMRHPGEPVLGLLAATRLWLRACDRNRVGWWCLRPHLCLWSHSPAGSKEPQLAIDPGQGPALHDSKDVGASNDEAVLRVDN